MKRPSFQFYPKDFLADRNVAVMTNEQVGGYLKLLCYMWMDEDCVLPSDEAYLAKLSGLDPESLRVVTKCFKVGSTNGQPTISHKRLDQERSKQDDWRKKSSVGGKKSAEKRWGNRLKNKGGYQMVQPNGNTPSSSPSITPLTPQGGNGGQGNGSSETRKMLVTWLKTMPDVSSPNSMADYYLREWGESIVRRALKNSNCVSRQKLRELCEHYKATQKNGSDP